MLHEVTPTMDYMFTKDEMEALVKQMAVNGSRVDIDNILSLFNLTQEEFTNFFMKPAPVLQNNESCVTGFENIKQGYSDLHGYFSLVVCILGTIANILNIIVLTRKEMVSPINAILTALAVTDMLVMVEYIPYAFHHYILVDRPIEVQFSYGWAVFVLFHANFTQVFHTISIWLTVTLAVWRYLAIQHPHRSQVLCSSQRCGGAIISAFIFPILLCIPSFLNYAIATPVSNKNLTLYRLDESELARNSAGFQKFHLWFYSIVIKLIPCLMLTVLSYWLIRVLYKANKRKQQLSSSLPDSALIEKKANKADKTTDRTTRMLLAILLLFLLTEFPQGILALLSGIHGRVFFMKCYGSFAEIMDFLALLNSAINFILYCSMSKQFRRTFSELFKPKVLVKWAHVSEVQTTFV